MVVVACTRIGIMQKDLVTTVFVKQKEGRNWGRPSPWGVINPPHNNLSPQFQNQNIRLNVI